MSDLDNKNLILVPCDFSTLSFHALAHGAYMSKAMNCKLLLLHVVAQETEIPLITKKLNFVAEECFDDFGIMPEMMVRQGSQPHSVIKSVANELKPTLAILKTAGGVNTVKILSGTSTPFLVIQGPPKGSEINNISFPVNFMHQHDEKMRRIVHFSEYYPDAVMHIITPSGKGTEKEKVISSNILLMTKVLEEQGIKIKFHMHDKLENKAEKIMELSKDADMIVVQMEETASIKKIFFGLREEKLITNAAKIPVLCFNCETHL